MPRRPQEAPLASSLPLPPPQSTPMQQQQQSQFLLQQQQRLYGQPQSMPQSLSRNSSPPTSAAAASAPQPPPLPLPLPLPSASAQELSRALGGFLAVIERCSAANLERSGLDRGTGGGGSGSISGSGIGSGYFGGGGVSVGGGGAQSHSPARGADGFGDASFGGGGASSSSSFSNGNSRGRSQPSSYSQSRGHSPKQLKSTAERSSPLSRSLSGRVAKSPVTRPLAASHANERHDPSKVYRVTFDDFRDQTGSARRPQLANFNKSSEPFLTYTVFPEDERK